MHVWLVEGIIDYEGSQLLGILHGSKEQVISWILNQPKFMLLTASNLVSSDTSIATKRRTPTKKMDGFNAIEADLIEVEDLNEYQNSG